MRFSKIKDETFNSKIGVYFSINQKSLIFLFKETRFYIHFN
jgi:hypothetical protein